nr:hypothetical protein [Agarilytica rhodophyticola]
MAGLYWSQRWKEKHALAWAPNKTAEAVKNALLKAFAPLAAWVKTLTYDNGKEFALHEEIALALNAKSYLRIPTILGNVV